MTKAMSTLSIVVTTIGRLSALEKLCATVAPQLLAGDELVLVAQRHESEVRELAATITTAATVIVTTSERGATLGRNTGVAASHSGEILVFPNDTTWFPAGSIQEIRSAAATAPVLSYTVRDEAGPKFSFEAKTGPVTYRSAWQVIEPGMAMRRSDFAAIGGFSTEWGPGAATPWQAGEGAELLFRWQRAFPQSEVTWNPAIEVGGVTDSAGLTGAERRRKLRAYGRGCGHVMAVFKHPFWFKTAYVLAGVLMPAMHRGVYAPFDGFWASLGRFEGVTGWVIGGGYHSVTR